jgi:DNA-binding HxlR family transcriptional regulator
MPRPKAERPAAEAPCASVQGGCEVGELFRVLGKTHMLDILHLFLHEEGPKRFVEVQHRLGLSPNTLTERLKELQHVGLLSRTAYNEIPPRVDYEATAKAKDLGPVFGALLAWAQRHTLTVEAPAAATAEAA